MDGGWLRISNGYAVPLSNLQSRLLRLLASRRSPDSYVAGGVAINRDGPRISDDIDIFQDGDERLVAIAEGDGAIIEGAGFKVTWLAGRGTGLRSAVVDGEG